MEKNNNNNNNSSNSLDFGRRPQTKRAMVVALNQTWVEISPRKPFFLVLTSFTTQKSGSNSTGTLLFDKSPVIFHNFQDPELRL